VTPAPELRRWGIPRAFEGRIVLACTVVAIVPIVTAAVRAAMRGWIPLGDRALIQTRAYDVFTSHTPLLGTWSSASLTAGRDVNNPGPLMFDVLALPVRIFGSDAGSAIGVALLNVLALIGIVLIAHRRGGATVAALAAAMTTVLCWSTGSEVLFDPFNPHMVVLPFLAFVLLVWSLACGDLVALPWAIGVGSFVIHTHLSYAVLVPVLGLWGVGALVVRLRRERRDREAWPDRARALKRAVVISAVVGAVCWIQSVIEQLTGEGEGNLSRLFHGMTSSQGDTVGLGSAARLVAGLLAVPPFWFRPSFGDTFFPGWREPSGVATALSLTVLGAVVGVCALLARRNRDQESLLAISTAVIGIIAGVMTTARAPLGIFGAATPHVLRWLWPLAAFTTFAIVMTLMRRGVDDASRHTRGLLWGATAVTVVFAVLTLPTSNQSGGPNDQQWAIDSATELRTHVGELRDRGPVLVDGLFDEVFDPYGAVILAEMQRRGIDYVADSHVLVRQLGDDRRYTGANAQDAVYVRTGDSAEQGLLGTERLAIVDGLTARERDELAELEEQVAADLEEQGVRLNADGRAALARGDLPIVRRQRADDAFDVDELLASNDVARMVLEDLIVLDDGSHRRFERYAELERQRRRETVALFVGPIEDRPA